MNSGTGWPADERDDHRDRLRAEGLRELRVRVDVDLGEHEAAAGLGDDLLEHGRELLARPAPLGPQVDDDRDGARELEHLRERLVGDIHDERREHSAGAPAAASGAGAAGRLRSAGQVDGAAQGGAESGIGHLITFASRMSEE